MLDYVELQTLSNFSFLRGASHPHELVSQACMLGYRAVAICDINSMAGVVRAHTEAKELGFRYIVGARLELSAPPCTVLAYPTSRRGYAGLCRLLTIGKRRVDKNSCYLTLSDLLEHQSEIALIFSVPDQLDAQKEALVFNTAAELKAGVKVREYLSIALNKTFSNYSARRAYLTQQISASLDIPLAACADAYYHIPERKALQDVLTCIRHKCTIDQAGFKLFQNAERCLRPLSEIKRLYRETPQALTRTVEIGEMCTGFNLDQLRYEYPDEICPAGRTPFEYLNELVESGATKRYPQGVPEKVRRLLTQELALISELNYERYFLTCYDIVRFAESRQILCQGRGAAANSAVCFCLGITAVDPAKIDLLFARFISKERNEPPDIDIDFEHERREEVIQYIYQRFGRERAGLTCEVITYRYRSAVREVSKALGLGLETADKLAKSIHRWTACSVTAQDVAALGLDPEDTRIRNTFTLSNELLGFPRHLSQHVGGFIICQQPLCESVPIGNAAMPDRTIIEWDKDDIEALGMLKIDVLGLGMLSCIRKALAYVNQLRLKQGQGELKLYNLPAEDPQVYEMICKADTIGVFQIESRAQMSMLPRLKPRCFYDLVIEVAIVRPGPIQGNMVHPYLKRRNGIEKITYPDKRVEEILGKTMGVPLFQEQAMRLAIVLAKFSPGEAEQLRRAMAAWKRDKGVIAIFRKRIIEGMLANGYALEFAESCMNQIKGFSEYGFPESHAASFALLVYASAWLKCRYPAEFAAALINSQPMGFYAPAQIVGDLKGHGVKVRAIDVNLSGWECTLERNEQGKTALRLGMRLVKGLGSAQAELISKAVQSYGRFSSIFQLWKIARFGAQRLRRSALQLLAKADAFGSLGLNSRQAFWEIRALPEEPLPLDDFSTEAAAQSVQLPLITKQEAIFQDYNATGLSLKGHPIGLIRGELNRLMVSTALALKNQRPAARNQLVSVAGIAIVRQRPHTAKGVVFVTLEDESGISNLIIKPEVFERYAKEIVSTSSMLAHGTLERVGEVLYISVHTVQSLDALILQKKRVSLPSRSYSY